MRSGTYFILPQIRRASAGAEEKPAHDPKQKSACLVLKTPGFYAANLLHPNLAGGAGGCRRIRARRIFAGSRCCERARSDSCAAVRARPWSAHAILYAV